MTRKGWYSIGYGSDRKGRHWMSYVSVQGGDRATLVGVLYRCAMAVDEPFTSFRWEVRKARNGDEYAKLTAVADSSDVMTGGPLHRERQSRVHRQMERAGSEAFREQRARLG